MNPGICEWCGQLSELIQLDDGQWICSDCEDKAKKCCRCDTWYHEDAGGDELCEICQDDMFG